MLTVLDFETTFQVGARGKLDPSPCDHRNHLVSAGWFSPSVDKHVVYRFFYHDDLERNLGSFSEELQDRLDQTTLLVAYNAKFELMWLRAAGFKLNPDMKIADPFIREYVLAKGQKLNLSLEETCKRYHGVSFKKSELINDYIKKKISFEFIPMTTIQEYGRQDVISTYELYEAQLKLLNFAEIGLWPTIELMEEFCVCLASIETDGIRIDTDALAQIEADYKAELADLEDKLQRIIYEVMGDTPINLDSPEDISKVVYSRKVIDKQEWKDVFNIGTEIRGSVRKPKPRRKFTNQEFAGKVLKLTDRVYKTRAKQCFECSGIGYIHKRTVSGQPYKKPHRCKPCNATGVIYEPTNEIGGLKFVPNSYADASEHGFSTDRETLIRLLSSSRNSTQKDFINYYIRRSQIETYLTTFCDGIRNGLKEVKDDDKISFILHPQFNQCVTATGRLTSSRPNFQNQPRGGTFPVRRSVVSRFPGGSILSADFRQLEFRIAGELSGDQTIFKEVLEGVDVHAATAKATNLTRQEAKSHTFAPLYGATEHGKADNIANYFRYFKQHYSGVYKWHQEMASSILANGGTYTLPSGRTYYYPNTKRYSNGSISNSTIIANYPVQGFATADLAIIASVDVFNRLRDSGCKSKMILQVHDDVTVDVYPGEEEEVIDILLNGMLSLKYECKRRYNYDLKIPIEVELKIGKNWLEQKIID